MRWTRLTHCLLLLALWLGATPVRAQALDLNAMPQGYLGTQTQLVFEDDAPLTWLQAKDRFDRGLGVPGISLVPGFGIGARPVWLRLRLNHTGTQPVRRELMVGPTWLDSIDAYLVHAQQPQSHWHTGDERPNAPGLVAASGYRWVTVFEPGVSELYVRIQSVDPMLIQLELLPAEQAEEHEHRVHYSYGFIYGFLLALVAYNLMLYFGLRERSHLLYSVYLATLIALDVAYTGHGLAYLWPHQPQLQRYAILGLMVLFGCAGLLFARRFLTLEVHAPQVNAWIKIGSGLALLGFLLTVVLQSQWAAAWLAFGFAAVFMVSMLLLGLLAVRTKRAAGRYFLVAVACGMTGSGSTFLAVLGLIPFNTASYHALEAGLILEATLLALAVAYHMRQHQLAAVRSEHLAQHDPLTGLLNRRAFLAQAQALWSTSERSTRPLSVVLLDLDHFKAINDTYGHATGDAALLACAQLLAQACRAGDVLVRWGGEEFILLLPETDLSQAHAFAERLRLQLAAQSLHTTFQAVPLTASFGVAQRHTHATLEDLISSADQALYQAKHQGRNRVVAAGLTAAP